MQRIREATFPKDLKQFSWPEMESAGLLSKFKHPAKWDNDTFQLFVLFSIQTNQLRKQRDNLKTEVEASKEYYSPLRIAAWMELCPIKQADLTRQALEEEARVNEERRKKRDGHHEALLRNPGGFSKSKWKRRDSRSLFVAFNEANWHLPMTVMDYHEATGLSRRSVQNILNNASLRPAISSKRRNEAPCYGLDANEVVLVAWLTRYVKDPAQRKPLAVRTLLHCQHETPDEIAFLHRAIEPAIRSLGIEDVEFYRYMNDCESILYPPPPPPPRPFADLFGSPLKLRPG